MNALMIDEWVSGVKHDTWMDVYRKHLDSSMLLERTYNNHSRYKYNGNLLDRQSLLNTLVSVWRNRVYKRECSMLPL